MEHPVELMSYIKSYDQQTYRLQVEGNIIKLELEEVRVRY